MNFTCSDCGKDFDWSPEGGWKGNFQASNPKMRCEECKELYEAEIDELWQQYQIRQAKNSSGEGAAH